MQIKSEFYDAVFPVEKVDFEDGSKMMIRHADLEQECIRRGFKVEFIDRFTKTSVNYADVMLCMTDPDTGRSAFGYGETNEKNLRSQVSAMYPHKMAFVRAFDDAALAIFGIKTKVIAESSYIPEENNKPVLREEPSKAADTSAPPLDDDTVIPFGPSRGKTWGEIKGTPEGERMLRFVLDRKESPYPDPVFGKLMALSERI
jgi:hypothetical protein